MDNNFYDLVDRYLAGTATPEEKRQVERWYAQLTAGNTTLSSAEQERVDKILLQSILTRIGVESSAGDEPPALPATTPVYRTPWFRYAAASVIILAIVGAGFLFQRQQWQQQGLASSLKEKRAIPDIAPASRGVTLDLGNARVLQLDSVQNGTLSADPSLGIQKTDARLTYSPGGHQTAYHTITTGKGNTYNLVLADGSRVWLDAESSLNYPTAFTGSDRSVQLTGQAYFEISKHKDKPFRVRFQDQLVEVLGTHFNINAHEGAAQTTLLEGSVRVSNNTRQSGMLAPGQQATVSPGKASIQIADADLDEVMAWKNGLFRFNGASVKEIMSQLERWYEIKVVYADDLQDVSLVARINKREHLATVLNLLEMTGQVRFVIDGNRVTVMNPVR